MGVCPGDQLLISQTDSSDDISSWSGSHTDDGLTVSSIPFSTILAMLEELKALESDSEYQPLGTSYEPSSNSIIPFRGSTRDGYQESICGQSDASTCKLTTTTKSEQRDATDEFQVVVVDISNSLWHPVGRYINGDGGLDPWTIFSNFGALESEVETDVGFELDDGWECEFLVCPDHGHLDLWGDLLEF
ncbi:hypothetical protein TWF506_005872 [Arthrobotrys conoides]|uniref:Uncharacterized protein n=1 Tax=Arthrobotrys conoides TaxID=74498 RepID=A0AAN8NEX0_9PEZI